MTANIAEDASSLVEVDYEVLTPVADCRKAIEPGAPMVRRELKTNVVATYKVNFGRTRKRLRHGRACVS